MAKQKKPGIKRESGRTGIDAEAEAKALKKWLRTVDRPYGRGAKRRGKQ